MPAIKCPFCSREIPERKQKTLTGRVRCPGCGSIGPLSELAALGEGRLPKGVTEREDGSVLHVSSLSAWSLPAVAAVPAAPAVFYCRFPERWNFRHRISVVCRHGVLGRLGGALRQPRDSPDSRRVCLPARIAEKEVPLDRLRLFKLARRPVPQRRFYHIGCMRKGGRKRSASAGLPLVRLAAAVEWMERRLYDSLGGEREKYGPAR